MNFSDRAFTFEVAEDRLVGIVAVPEKPKLTGVLIVVGGPQYRIGSHRQFLLLARALAATGYPVMRFDYRGMGDSSGDLRDFTRVNDDIGSAIDAFYVQCPDIQKVVLWGLCDAASASLLYGEATRDSRLAGMVLLNPWIRSEATLARAHIKHYYGQRLLDPQFWRKLVSGNVGIGRAVSGFIKSLLSARHDSKPTGPTEGLSFQQKMLLGMADFREPVLMILSGDDYTAKEFQEASRADQAWLAALARENVTQVTVDNADHTFSSAEWRGAVEKITLDWLDGHVGQ